MSLGCILVQGALDNQRTPQEQSLASVMWQTLCGNKYKYRQIRLQALVST